MNALEKIATWDDIQTSSCANKLIISLCNTGFLVSAVYLSDIEKMKKNLILIL